MNVGRHYGEKIAPVPGSNWIASSPAACCVVYLFIFNVKSGLWAGISLCEMNAVGRIQWKLSVAVVHIYWAWRFRVRGCFIASGLTTVRIKADVAGDLCAIGLLWTRNSFIFKQRRSHLGNAA